MINSSIITIHFLNIYYCVSEIFKVIIWNVPPHHKGAWICHCLIQQPDNLTLPQCFPENNSCWNMSATIFIFNGKEIDLKLTKCWDKALRNAASCLPQIQALQTSPSRLLWKHHFCLGRVCAWLLLAHSSWIVSLERTANKSALQTWLPCVCSLCLAPFAPGMGCKNTSSPDLALAMIPSWILKTFQASLDSKWAIFSWTAVQCNRYLRRDTEHVAESGLTKF